MEKDWALVLGGSNGLGLATATKLAKHGLHIVIVHRDRRSEMDTIEANFEVMRTMGVQVKTFNADALSSIRQKELVKEIKTMLPEGHHIKVLVHSIAKGSLKPMHPKEGAPLSNQDIKITFEAMALSLYEWTRLLVDENLFAADSRIISFTSEGNTRALPNYGAVSAAKVALEALTRNMALEFAPLGIRANCIQAGVTLTKSFQMIPGQDQIKEHALKRNPNGRLTTPEDVANAAYLLTRDEAKWITGTIIKVDGGESLR